MPTTTLSDSDSLVVFQHPQIDQSIFLLDSGTGVHPVLAECQRLLPRERFRAIIDQAGHPYGEGKSLERIADHALRALEPHFQKGNCKAMVMACNTASHEEILAHIHFKLGIRPLGMIEASARDLLQRHGYGRNGRPLRIVLMGTPALIKYGAWVRTLLHLAREMGLPSPDIIEVPCPGLATAIDRVTPGKEYELRAHLPRSLYHLPEVDVLIAGCTHFCKYPVRALIAEAIGSKVVLWDSIRPVAEELWRQLGNQGLRRESGTGGAQVLRNCGQDADRLQRAA